MKDLYVLGSHLCIQGVQRNTHPKSQPVEKLIGICTIIGMSTCKWCLLRSVCCWSFKKRFSLCLNCGLCLKVGFSLFVSARRALMWALLIKKGERGSSYDFLGSQGPVVTSCGNCDAFRVGQVSGILSPGHCSLNSCIADTAYF